jgi:hypothetical protein
VQRYLAVEVVVGHIEVLFARLRNPLVTGPVKLLFARLRNCSWVALASDAGMGPDSWLPPR